LLLDEPSAGLAPVIVDRVFDIVRNIRQGGTTLVLVEQNARLALDLATYGHVLAEGRVVMHGNAATLKSTPALADAYLGVMPATRASFKERS
jgi:branched-chain amino acid transport system ATP-binding protein